MTFKLDNLKTIGNNQGAGKTPLFWMYLNADSDTVTTAGYIPNNVGMSAKDQVLVVPAAGGKGTFYAATVSSGKITLSAS